jgi:hypothetical protein
MVFSVSSTVPGIAHIQNSGFLTTAISLQNHDHDHDFHTYRAPSFEGMRNELFGVPCDKEGLPS